MEPLEPVNKIKSIQNINTIPAEAPLNQDQHVRNVLPQMQMQQQVVLPGNNRMEEERRLGELMGNQRQLKKNNDQIFKKLNDFIEPIQELDRRIQEKQREKDALVAEEPANAENIEQELEALNNQLATKKANLRKLAAELFSSENAIIQSQKEVIKQQAGMMDERQLADLDDQIELLYLKKSEQLLNFFKKEPWPKYVTPNFKSKEGLSLKEGISKRQERVAYRKQLHDGAEKVAKGAALYKEGGSEGMWKDMPIPELLNLCAAFADQIWNHENNRKKYLNIEYLLNHIQESFLIIAGFDQLAERINSGKIRGQVNNNNMQKTIRILSFYKNHVNTILKDFGMDLEHLAYDTKTIEAIVSREQVLPQIQEWNQDYDLYKNLADLQENRIDQAQPNGVVVQQDRIGILEYKVGIVHDERRQNVQAKDKETDDQIFDKLDWKDKKIGSILRVNPNITNLTVNRVREFERTKRLFNISEHMIEKLKQEGVWEAQSDFQEISELYFQNMKLYENKDSYFTRDYLKEDQEYQRKVRNKLKNILRKSSIFQEKQYASLILDYIQREQDGDLIKNYSYDASRIRWSDRQFTDMNKTMTDKEGRKYKDNFESRKDEPLFEHEPNVRDVKQGDMGDCYFISALASIVAKNPLAIKRMMRDNHDGTVTVHFYNPVYDTLYGTFRGKILGTKDVYVTVEKTIPMRTYEGEKKSIDPYATGSLWVKMLEKAYAVVKGKGPMKQILDLDKRRVGYMNLKSGVTHDALCHLLGTRIDDVFLTNNIELQVFTGRLPSCCIQRIGNKKIDTPGLLYFQKKHQIDKDNSAFRYLAGQSVSQWKKEDYQRELLKYLHIERVLEQIMMDREGLRSLQAMDRVSFCEASKEAMDQLTGILESLVNSKGRKFSTEDFVGKGLSAKAGALMSNVWEKCNRDASAIETMAKEMLELFNNKLNRERLVSEYTEEEERFAARIQKVLDGGGYAAFGTKELKLSEKEKINNTNEDIVDGMVTGHGYAISRVEKHEIGGKNKIFFRMANPYGNKVPFYRLGENGELKRIPFRAENKDDLAYEESTHGIFLLELRDARSIMGQLITAEGR